MELVATASVKFNRIRQIFFQLLYTRQIWITCFLYTLMHVAI